MFRRAFKTITSRVQISSAFLYSNGIAGGFAGSLFTFGNVFKIPLNFGQGYFPAALSFFVRAFFFIRKLTQQYEDSDPHNPSVQLKAKERFLSTGLIIDLLKRNQEASKGFLERLHLNQAEIDRLYNWTDTSNDHLQDVLNKMFNEMQWGFEKYSMSLLISIFSVAAHFMEVMLLQLYHKPDLFDFDHGPNYANVALCMLGFAALLNGIIEFDNTKLSYERPTPSVLCDTIFKSYQKYCKQHIIPEQDEKNDVVLSIR